jgi:hypothetical protein
MAFTSINVRSPRIVDIAGTANQTTKVELFIWNDPDSIPSNPTFTLDKPIPSSIITETSYDISPYCRRYINHTKYTEVTADTAAPVEEYCFCTVKEYLDGVLQLTTEFIAFDGFGYHSEGENPQQGDEFLTDGTYYVNASGNTGGVYYHDDQAVTWEATYTGTTSGGTTTITLANEVGYIPYVHTNYVNEGNTLEIKRNSVVQNTYVFEQIDECKYDIVNCDFVNKHGGWQRLVFFKASRSSLEMTNTEYNLMPQSTSYDVQDNVRSVFNVNAMEKISCNTGWVPEAYSDVMTQLIMSEKVMINDEPVILDTKSIDLQKNINDKNINYKMDFRYSAPKLNYNI